MSRILVIGNGTGSKHYRYVPGARFLEENGHQVMIVRHDDDQLVRRIESSDVVLFQMAFSPELIGVAKRLGKRVIVEADDLLHRVPALHYSHEELSGFGSVKWWFRVWNCLRQADGFVCTTEELRRRYGWMCRRSLVWRNWCDIQHWVRPVRRNMGNDVRILWAGSVSHTADLLFVQPVIREVLHRNPNAKFVYIGHGGAPSDDLYTQFVYGEDLFDGIAKGRREMALPVESVVWPSVLNGLVADIAIAPLVRDEEGFAQAKSQCKFIEYGINAIPAVYSRWHYTDVRDGVDGLLADTPEEWVEALDTLVRDRGLREKLGANARTRILDDFDSRPHLKEWGDFVLGKDCDKP